MAPWTVTPAQKACAVFLAALAGVLVLAAVPARAEVVFRAVCSDVTGHRVDMDPTGTTHAETWKAENYGPAAMDGGTGVLGFVSDDAHPDTIRVTWGKSDQRLPIVYKNEGQISLAETDANGIWIYTLYFRADKVLISRQTNEPRFGAVGSLLTADCVFTPD
jgi:hypothetical protein